MIIGIGTDVVYIPRIETLYKKYGERLIKKILTEKEQERLQRVSHNQICKHLAKRFAAKEALVKSIGIGFSNSITLSDISVLNDQMGKPYYEVSEKLTKYIYKLSNGNAFFLHLSLSDEYPVASAFTILENT